MSVQSLHRATLSYIVSTSRQIVLKSLFVWIMTATEARVCKIVGLFAYFAQNLHVDNRDVLTSVKRKKPCVRRENGWFAIMYYNSSVYMPILKHRVYKSVAFAVHSSIRQTDINDLFLCTFTVAYTSLRENFFFLMLRHSYFIIHFCH